VKIKRFFITSLLVLLICSRLPAEEMVLYGSDEGWGNTVSEGLRETLGWRGNMALTLAPLGRNPFLPDTPDLESDVTPEDIDLLILAEPRGMENPVGHYRIEGDYQISSQFSARGETSIRLVSGGLKLYPSPAAMWSAGKKWDDFTLDFRLRPTTLRNGEIFFSWQGRNSDGELQSVIARVENRRLIWEFQGFFRQNTKRSINLQLVSLPLIPGEWRHHRIRFKRDSSNSGRSGASPGLLEYLVDGVPSDMVHATPYGREGLEPFYPLIGLLTDQPIQLAPSFSGYIDEFRLASAYDSTPPAGGYSDLKTAVSGKGYTNPVDSGFPGSFLKSLKARVEMPGSTQVRFFIRTLDSRDEFGELGFPDPADSNWKKLNMREQPADPTGFGRWYEWRNRSSADALNIKGRYFVIGYILDPDPAADLAPVLSILEMEYEPRTPPRPPRDLRWQRGDDNRIRISWSSDTEEAVAGWWISWGPRPGDYATIDSGILQEDEIRGSVWVPRKKESISNGKRPEYEWPREMENRIIYTSIRAAWEGGGPGMEDPSHPGDYRALSEPTREINFRP